MTFLGIAEAVVAPLVRALVEVGHDRDGTDRDARDREALDRDTLDRDALGERFARACWTGIAEPGDRMAGLLLRALGAERALGLLIDARDAAPIAAALAEVGAEDVNPKELVDAVARWSPRISTPDALRSLRQAARFGARLVVPGDTAWPAGFDDLGDCAPFAIWVRGRVEALAELDRSIALVGARAATGYGEHVTVEASSGLVDRGYAIVSGAAYGIDGAAHRAALASRGTTIAFLAGGLDRFYPSGHEALLTRIIEAGAAVSEVPCGTAPTKWRFLQRNRLIAAASRAVVVVEAGWRSGSLNTAAHAAALGRPLGAVPGPVTSSASAGCHRMLREFPAICVTNADEMAELAPLDDRPMVFDGDGDASRRCRRQGRGRRCGPGSERRPHPVARRPRASVVRAPSTGSRRSPASRSIGSEPNWACSNSTELSGPIRPAGRGCRGAAEAEQLSPTATRAEEGRRPTRLRVR